MSIALRHGILCKPLLNERTEYHLMPKPAVSIVVQGYNYEDTPVIYRDGQRVTPLEFERNYSSMVYFYMVYAPNGKCNHEWILETTDFVKPVVTDGMTGEDFIVILERRRGGFNRWRLVCR